MRRRWLLKLSLIAAISVMGIGVVLWQSVGLSSLSRVSEHVAAAKPFAGALRFALIGLLALAWPRLTACWRGANPDDDRARAHWMALRWRVVGWLLVIELVLGQNLAGHALTAIADPVA